MSLAKYSNTKITKVIDPQVNINQEKKYDFLAGVRNVLYRNVDASSASNSNISFSYRPSSQVLIGRKLYVKYALRITFTGTTSLGGNLLNIGLDDALRSFPLQSNSSSISFKINGENISSNSPNQYLHALERFVSYADTQSQDFAPCPSLPDAYQQYEDAKTVGYARNPLGQWGENPFQQNRGAASYYTVNSNTPTTADVTCFITEPLLLPTTCFGKQFGPGFASVQDLQLLLTLSNGLQRVWSHSANSGATLTSVSVGISTTSSPAAPFNPILQLAELTPDPTCAVVEANKPYVYPYSPLFVNVFDAFSNVTAGSTVSTAINSIQYGVVPEKVWVFCKERLSDQEAGAKNWTSTDTFARINNLSIIINGKSAVLSEATPEQLYQISVASGSKQTWSGFRQYEGSVFCATLGRDIPLDPETAVGTVNQFNFQVSNMSITNTSVATKNYQVVIVAQASGMMAIQDNTCALSTGVMSSAEGVMAPLTAHGYMALNQSFGGSFWDTLKKAALSVARPIVSGARTIRDVTGAVSDVGSMLGLGRAMKKKAKKGGAKRSSTKAKRRVRLGRGITGDLMGGAISRQGETGTMEIEDLYDESEESQSDE